MNILFCVHFFVSFVFQVREPAPTFIKKILPLENNLPTYVDVLNVLRPIFIQSQYVFKINAFFGYYLKNTITGESDYFYPGYNTKVLVEPCLITDYKNLKDFCEKVSQSNFFSIERPSTKFKLDTISDITFNITFINDHLISNKFIGHNQGDNLKFIKHNKYIIDLKSRSKNKNLCFFRCLAYFKLKKRNGLEKCLLVFFYKNVSEGNSSRFSRDTIIRC